MTRLLGILELFVAVGALGGGGALIAAPDGHWLGMNVAFLDDTPFRDFLIPGLVLCFVVGGSTLTGGILALRRRNSARRSAILAGLVLTGWIGTQLLLIGYRFPIQGIFLGLGLLILILGVMTPTHPSTSAR